MVEHENMPEEMLHATLALLFKKKYCVLLKANIEEVLDKATDARGCCRRRHDVIYADKQFLLGLKLMDE